MELTPEVLEEMKAVDVRTVDINTLTDIRDIVVDTKKPVKAKLESLAAQTNNLYLYRFGDYVVKVSYQESGVTINEKMGEYIRRLSEIYI